MKRLALDFIEITQGSWRIYRLAWRKKNFGIGLMITIIWFGLVAILLWGLINEPMLASLTVKQRMLFFIGIPLAAIYVLMFSPLGAFYAGIVLVLDEDPRIRTHK